MVAKNRPSTSSLSTGDENARYSSASKSSSSSSSPLLWCMSEPTTRLRLPGCGSSPRRARCPALESRNWASSSVITSWSSLNPPFCCAASIMLRICCLICSSPPSSARSSSSASATSSSSASSSSSPSSVATMMASSRTAHRTMLTVFSPTMGGVCSGGSCMRATSAMTTILCSSSWSSRGSARNSASSTELAASPAEESVTHASTRRPVMKSWKSSRWVAHDWGVGRRPTTTATTRGSHGRTSVSGMQLSSMARTRRRAARPSRRR
mmetsp:Transcript_3721/g.12817  ORF Transcript_3721/g.12817 Transcript_3721/m.12817 type:complete len:267 (-) Transcript_3721:880-1680(-)